MEIGSIVVINLQGPREQILGKLINLSSSGVTIRGIDVNSFRDWMNQFSQPETIHTMHPTTVFFPMHRVVSCYLDEDMGAVPSFGSQFAERSNQDLGAVLEGEGER